MAKEYIEREAAINLLHYYTDERCSSVVADFESIPAAEVAPVVHGEWIIHTEHFAPYQQCSVCGFEIPIIATENELDIGLFRYCPDCGCRMDLEG